MSCRGGCGRWVGWCGGWQGTLKRIEGGRQPLLWAGWVCSPRVAFFSCVSVPCAWSFSWSNITASCKQRA